MAASQPNTAGQGMYDQEACPVKEIESLQEWTGVIGVAGEIGMCGLGLQTTGQDPLASKIRLACVALPDRGVCAADLFRLGSDALDELAVLMEDGRVMKVMHEAKVGLAFLRAMLGRRLKFKNVFDIMLASQVCWSGFYDLVPSSSKKNPWKKRPVDHSLEALAERHLGVRLDRSQEVLEWSEKPVSRKLIRSAARRAQTLLPLQACFQELIRRNHLERVADIELRAIAPVVEMELSGIYLDEGAARKLAAEKEAALVRAVMDLQAEARDNGYQPRPGEEERSSRYLNPESKEEVRSYLEGRGFMIASTRSEVLRDLAAKGCIFADRLLCYRNLNHQLAFLSDWLKQIHPADGRIHPRYFQLQSATGRLSSRKPNAQQVPKRGDDGLAIRKLFKAPPGKKLVKVDFSCLEMRIMAYLSRDLTMIRAFQEGEDLHRLTASRISGVPVDQVTKEQRQAAKSANFLLIYGGSAETLQRRAYYDYGVVMSWEEVQEVYRKYFETFSGVREWQERQRMALNYTHPHYFHDCVRGFFYLPLTCTFTATGRRRAWPRFGQGIKASRFQAYNTPSQGTGADLIKLVMAELYDQLDSEEARLIGSIHDELLLEVPEDQAEKYARMVSEMMNRIGSELLYPVPVTSEAEILSSWGG